jgi:ribosome-interacting GTPase 1
MDSRKKYNAQMVRYADDIVILTDSKETQHIRQILESLLSELGLKMSAEKSRKGFGG